MTARPVTLAAAVVLLAIIGAAFVFVGVLLMVVATGGLGADLAAGASTMVVTLALIAIAAAVLTVAAAAGLWRGRAWGWAGSLAVALVATLGAVIALDSSGAQLPVLLGFALAVAAVILLLVPSTRAAAGVG